MNKLIKRILCNCDIEEYFLRKLTKLEIFIRSQKQQKQKLIFSLDFV